MTKEELLKRKKKCEDLLKQADEENRLILCIQLGEELDKIDKELIDMGVD